MGLPPVIHFNRSFSTSAYCSTLLSCAKLQEFASKRTFHLELHEIAETFDAFGGDRLGIWRLKVRTLERAWRQSSYQDDTAVLVLAQGFASCTCRLPLTRRGWGGFLCTLPVVGSELESTELTERTYKAVRLLQLLLFGAFIDADVSFAFVEIKNNTATLSFDMLMATKLDELFVVTDSAAAARRPISMFMQRPDILNYLGRTFFTGRILSKSCSIY